MHPTPPTTASTATRRRAARDAGVNDDMPHKPHSNPFTFTTLALLSIGVAALTACGYKVEDDKVYYVSWNEGQGRAKEVIPGADAASFQVLKHKEYAKDRNYGYFEGVRIEGVEPLSFSSIHEVYAVDNRRAYYGGQVIERADGMTFAVVDPNWSRDKSDYYYMTSPIGVCDRETFRVRSEEFNWWASDSKCLYFQGKKVPLRDRASAIVYRCGFSKDRFGVYFGNRPVNEADPATFTMYRTPDGVDTCMGTDKNGCYAYGVKSKCPS